MKTSLKSLVLRAAIVLTAITITLLPLALNPMRAGAASYIGSGKKSDPYLVSTRDQLDGIRNNLSAFYKLADTIDMSGSNFTPIGTLDKPFTGTFTCDKGEDGNPKYAILNLKISVAITPDSVSKKMKRECGLFGATNGATISWIYVLNADVENKNIGRFGMDGKGVIDNFNEENAAGILIGIATSTEVTHCASTGSVKGACNWAGGLIGRPEKSEISYSFSTAGVSSTGVFGIGGFVGTSEYSNIKFCYATGNVSGSGENPTRGGFIGQGARSNGIPQNGTEGKYVLQNCYSTGKVTVSAASSFAGYSGGDEAQAENKLKFTNCYTTGVVEGRNNPWDVTVTSCDGYILNSINGAQSQFAAVSKDVLKSKFTGLSGWDTSGDMPVIKDIKALSSARIAQYKPGMGEQAAAASGSSNNAASGTGNTSGGAGSASGGANNNTGTTNDTADDADNTTADTDNDSAGDTETAVADVSEVISLLKALPDSDSIKVSDVPGIVKAFRAYDALTDDDKLAIEEELLTKKADIALALPTLALRYLKDEIDKLPESGKLTAADKDKVNELQSVFTYLDEATQKMLAPAASEKLSEAVEKVKSLTGGAQDASALLNPKPSTAEWAIFIVMAVLVFLTIAGTAMVTVLEFNMRKKYLKP